jgi:hypothetical protein
MSKKVAWMFYGAVKKIMSGQIDLLQVYPLFEINCLQLGQIFYEIVLDFF